MVLSAGPESEQTPSRIRTDGPSAASAESCFFPIEWDNMRIREFQLDAVVVAAGT